MKRVLRPFAIACVTALSLTACQKASKEVAIPAGSLSQATIAKISALGFSTDNARKVDGGYLVEGDIILTDENLSSASSSPTLLIANEEQYRTTNLVSNLPRNITVSVTNMSTVYSNATDEAIRRYNALGTGLTFVRASGGTGNIDIYGFNEGPSGGYITLGSAGFPTSSGNPYNQVKMNTNQYAYGANPDLNYVASVIQHEIGHCIGFRHTDYMNRAYSCGGRRSNEGSAGVGAIQVPGTPSKADAGSFMLACSNGSNRTFNTNDVVAMNYLY